MGWNFYNSSGELQINDGGVTNPIGANLDLSSYLLVGNAGSTGIAISANGEVVMAAQPAFSAYNSSQDLNVTGASTSATIDFDTEAFDQNGDFASDTFTAPVTGKYMLSARVTVKNLTTAGTSGEMDLVTPNRTYRRQFYDADAGLDSTTASIVVVADMDAGEAATVTLVISGTSDIYDIEGHSTLLFTSFSGCLLA